MANVKVEKVGLKLDLDGGIINGKQKIVSRSYSSIKENAEDNGLIQVANSLTALGTMGLMTIRKTVTSILEEDEVI